MNCNADIRDIFFNNIKKIFLKNTKYFICTNDADVLALKQLKKNRRFIDAGVAEQNLINIAAGLASQSKLPIIYGFCTFLTFRCYEQIKFNIASHNLNCKIVGIGPGLSFSNDGPTHHGIQDLYLMYLIPEMEVINISDNNLANIISKKLNSIKGPVYIRLDKGVCDFNRNINYDLNIGFNYTIKNKNSKILVITTGSIINSINRASLDQGKTNVINFFKFKNYNKLLFKKEIIKYKKILIIDENAYSGGIIPIINSLLIDLNFKGNVKHLSLPDKQFFRYSTSRESLLKEFKLDLSNIKKFIDNC